MEVLNINVYNVGLTQDEFCTQYRELIVKMGVMDGLVKENIERRKGFLGLSEINMWFLVNVIKSTFC